MDILSRCCSLRDPILFINHHLNFTPGKTRYHRYIVDKLSDAIKPVPLYYADLCYVTNNFLGCNDV
jgi:hypothetical protein